MIFIISFRLLRLCCLLQIATWGKLLRVSIKEHSFQRFKVEGVWGCIWSCGVIIVCTLETGNYCTFKTESALGTFLLKAPLFILIRMKKDYLNGWGFKIFRASFVKLFKFYHILSKTRKEVFRNCQNVLLRACLVLQVSNCSLKYFLNLWGARFADFSHLKVRRHIWHEWGWVKVIVWRLIWNFKFSHSTAERCTWCDWRIVLSKQLFGIGYNFLIFEPTNLFFISFPFKSR